uniref:Uncharacterized protein n=1 Tax=Arundo donax TaxID=35708 RepID=A0A0A9AWS9_ARUDO
MTLKRMIAQCVVQRIITTYCSNCRTERAEVIFNETLDS